MDQVKLTSLSSNAGCGAKIGPGVLSKVLKKMPEFIDERLLVGNNTLDDACVYKINDDTAIVQTLDFFTPIVDDPYMFGQIAATNALSDIYAMGGDPILALNIVAFPAELEIDVLGEILKGGADKVKEAGATLAGGHSIIDKEPKYGLCVTGLINPNKILKNFGLKDNDKIILTKPIGTGLISTAIKADFASKEDINLAMKYMSTLNKKAKDIISKYDVHALTDVTGFGLGCHLLEMSTGSNKKIQINVDSIKLMGNAKEYSLNGFVPAGSYRNRNHAKEFLEVNELVEDTDLDIVFDPQTSGGLLIGVDKETSEKLVKDFIDNEMGDDISVVAEVIGEGKGIKLVR